ncbi:MAG: AEC family transporter [Desulfobacterales bacterium]
MIVFNSIFPVFGLIFLGVILKRIGLTNSVFLAAADRLIYFAFFPLLLFWKIGGASTVNIDWTFCGAVILAVAAVFLISLAVIRIVRIGDYQAGTFAQSCFRFNSYIGIAIVLNATGEEGFRLLGVLIGFVIPIINVLSVITLIWYSGKNYSAGQRNRMLAKALVSNPLILGCLAGIIYANTAGRFPAFLNNTFELAGSMTLPLALISIGGGLTLSGFRQHRKQAFLAAAVKLLVLPVVGFGFLRWFDVSGLPLYVGMIYFTLPTSSVIYVLSSQLNSDTELAYASIVVSTVLSIFSMTLAMAFFQL